MSMESLIEVDTKHKKQPVKQYMVLSTNNYVFQGEMLFNLADGYGSVSFNQLPFKYVIDSDDKEVTINIQNISDIHNFEESVDAKIKESKPQFRYTYTGMFMNGKLNGIGGLKDNVQNVTGKGQWRDNNRHGYFTVTEIAEETSYKIIYKSDKMISKHKRQYIAEQYLAMEPRRRKTDNHNVLPASDSKCTICYINPVNATIVACGHTNACFTCLSKVDKCPTCRVSIGQKIKIFT